MPDSVQPNATGCGDIQSPLRYGSYTEFVQYVGEIVRRIEIAVSMEVYRRPMREDVRQLACLSVVISWRRLPLEPKRQFGYLRRVVRNENFDHREREGQSHIDAATEEFPSRAREVLERLAGMDQFPRSMRIVDDFQPLYDALANLAIQDSEGVNVLFAREAYGATWRELEQVTGKRRNVLRRRLARVKARIRSDHPELRALLD